MTCEFIKGRTIAKIAAEADEGEDEDEDEGTAAASAAAAEEGTPEMKEGAGEEGTSWANRDIKQYHFHDLLDVDPDEVEGSPKVGTTKSAGNAGNGAIANARAKIRRIERAKQLKDEQEKISKEQQATGGQVTY